MCLLLYIYDSSTFLYRYRNESTNSFLKFMTAGVVISLIYSLIIVSFQILE